MPKSIAVLAFSGGLDTSYCVKYLMRERCLDVHTVLVNTGGFQEPELQNIAALAYDLGATKHIVLDQSTAFYDECIRFLVAGNVLKNNSYPLSVSAERVFQALAVARYAREIGAAFIAHGCTGAGNDQVRFDSTFHIVCPEINVIAPIREQKLSRAEEIAYLQAANVTRDWTKATYSINKGLWGTSVGGAETLTSERDLPEAAFPTQRTKTDPESITLEFKHGHPVALNGAAFSHPTQLIQALSDIAAPFGIGRDIHVGDTILGIKGRVGFEAAAPLVIIKAHHALEKHVLTKLQLNLKDEMALEYGNLVHDGQFLEPALRDMEAFFAHTQKNVTGTVHVHLAPYRFHIMGVTSAFDLMSSKFGVYGEMNHAWEGTDVMGFTKIRGMQTAIYHRVNRHA